jgi:hypothetical protein
MFGIQGPFALGILLALVGCVLGIKAHAQGRKGDAYRAIVSVVIGGVFVLGRGEVTSMTEQNAVYVGIIAGLTGLGLSFYTIFRK